MIRSLKLFAGCVESLRTAEKAYEEERTAAKKKIVMGLQEKVDGWILWILNQEDKNLAKNVPPFIGKTSLSYWQSKLSGDVLNQLMETHTPDEIEKYNKMMQELQPPSKCKSMNFDKNKKAAYSEIMKLRNEFYQKWQDASQYDDNKGAYKAKYEAFDKAMELMTPSIVESQPKESIEYNPFDDFRHTDSEEPVSEDMEAEFLRAAHNLREQPTLSAWFRHFYNLGKQQIMNDAVDGVTKVDNNGNILLEANLNHLAKNCDLSQRVKLVIIKED